MHWRRRWQPSPVFLPGESQGWGSLVGCRLWGHAESDTTEATLQQQQQQQQQQHRQVEVEKEGTFLSKEALEFVQLDLVKATPTGDSLLGGALRLNTHAHVYTSNNSTRTTNKFEMEKMPPYCLFGYSPT